MELGDAFHAYIIDWRLPDMNGIEVTRQIRSLGDDTPIIILTAYDWSDIEVEARAAGVTAFCAKPLFMSDIRDTLMTAIGQMQAETEDTPLSAAGSDFRDKCILLVEDNELNREITVEILNEYGCMVDTAENGAEAVEKVKNSKPGNYDLVLMDVQMPVMNGYEATKQFKFKCFFITDFSAFLPLLQSVTKAAPERLSDCSTFSTTLSSAITSQKYWIMLISLPVLSL